MNIRKVLKAKKNKSKDIRPKQLLEQTGPRLHANGRHLGYRRGRRIQHPAQSLLSIDDVHTKEDASFYVGKAVHYVYHGKKEVKGTTERAMKGTVTRVHGNSGAVMARFERPLPAESFGCVVRVMLYPSRI
ncbi:MAG: 60S ribosomal protein L35A [Amphiamblys sp. WSBS2006]|nr:MAG: 60S ribosomal protein L35A [Amphiamblys sp. WSBS2006]